MPLFGNYLSLHISLHILEVNLFEQRHVEQNVSFRFLKKKPFHTVVGDVIGDRGLCLPRRKVAGSIVRQRPARQKPAHAPAQPFFLANRGLETECISGLIDNRPQLAEDFARFLKGLQNTFNFAVSSNDLLALSRSLCRMLPKPDRVNRWRDTALTVTSPFLERSHKVARSHSPQQVLLGDGLSVVPVGRGCERCHSAATGIVGRRDLGTPIRSCPTNPGCSPRPSQDTLNVPFLPNQFSIDPMA